MQLRLAFHEARSEADKIVGSNLGIKEQEIVIARLTEQVNAKTWSTQPDESDEKEVPRSVAGVESGQSAQWTRRR